MKNTKGHFILLVLAAVCGGAIFLTARANDSLRREQALLRSQLDEIARLKTGNALLQASLPPEAVFQKLTQEAQEGAELRERIDKLNETQRRLSRQLQKRAEERWLNVGQATPASTLGSVVWAATGGEVDLLASMLAYDPESRAAAENLFASLPEESRKLFPSAEKLIATFISGRVPTDLSRAEPVNEANEGPGLVRATYKLQRSTKANAEPREVTFHFQRVGSDWKLLVPKSVVAEIQASLK